MENTAKIIEELENKCALQEQQIAELTAKVAWFEEQFRLSQQRRFGRSSEQTGHEQMQLFNEAESEADSSIPGPAMKEITYRCRKKKGHREAKIKDLPQETIEYRLPPEEQVCSCCGSELHVMSTQTRQEIKIIPAQVSVINHVQYVYACRRCEREETKTPIVTAPKPAPVLPGSLASPSAIAHIMTQKYVDAVPLYRQEQSWSRLGVELSRQTMANWVVQGADRWLSLLYERMHELLLEQDILHADETELQVLREPGRSATSNSYLWLYRTGRASPAIVLYDYRTTRASKHPKRFLSSFDGYLHVDGYPGYNGLPDITLAAEKKDADVAAKKGLEFCNQLFAIERKLHDVSPEERYKTRLKRSCPVVDAFRAWLDQQRPKVLPKSALGQAINYCISTT